jgi:hypothetical protein
MKCVVVVQKRVYAIFLQGVGCGLCVSCLVTVSKYNYREVSIKLVIDFSFIAKLVFKGKIFGM